MSTLKVLRCSDTRQGHGPMLRRNFIALIAGIAALPLAAHAQQAVPSMAQAASTDISKCAQNSVGFPQPVDGPRWNGWGADLGNSRFQPAAMAGLTRDQVPLLRLKWAFGFHGRSAAVAQPTIIGGLVFVGGGDREVYALDAKSGCTRWVFKTEAVVRTAISFAPISGTDQYAVFFGDLHANAYAVNAITGALIWKTKVEDHRAAEADGAAEGHRAAVLPTARRCAACPPMRHRHRRLPMSRLLRPTNRRRSRPMTHLCRPTIRLRCRTRLTTHRR